MYLVNFCNNVLTGVYFEVNRVIEEKRIARLWQIAHYVSIPEFTVYSVQDPMLRSEDTKGNKTKYLL